MAMDINTTLLFIGGMRGWQLIIIVLVVVLLFGGKKIPELMRGLGSGVKYFKEGLSQAKKEMETPVDAPSAAKEDAKTRDDDKA